MKKVVSIVLVVVLIMAVVSGCAKKSDFEKAVDAYKGQTVTTTLDFWGNPVDVDLTISDDGKTFEYAYNFMGNDLLIGGTIDGEEYTVTDDPTGMGAAAAPDIFNALVEMNTSK